MFPKNKEQFLERMTNLRGAAGFLEPGTPPVRILDPEGRLHSTSGPSYRSATRITWYSEGKKHGLDADIFGSMIYYWRGVVIPDSFYTRRDQLEIEDVLLHPNTEVRSVGLEIYGYDRLALDPKCQIIHKDRVHARTLFRFRAEGLHEPLVFVKVKNSSPEPDGSFRDYFLCVPPQMKTCQEAVAWTFDLQANEYSPAIET